MPAVQALGQDLQVAVVAVEQVADQVVAALFPAGLDGGLDVQQVEGQQVPLVQDACQAALLGAHAGLAVAVVLHEGHDAAFQAG